MNEVEEEKAGCIGTSVGYIEILIKGKTVQLIIILYVFILIWRLEKRKKIILLFHYLVWITNETNDMLDQLQGAKMHNL